MILIKLGGSVLTNKDRKYSFRTQVVKRLINEIKESSAEEYIIVHGGGSFGHPGAEKYGLHTTQPEKPAEGLSRVQLDMRRMNNHLLEIMLERGIWGVSIPGGLITLFEDGELYELDQEIFQRYLSLDTLPVSFGDVAIDKNRGLTICSGDDIMLGLSSLADRAVFVSDVDGIYRDGELKEVFTEDMLPLKKADLPDDEDTIDVTGGMNRKVEKMLQISDDAETHLVNGKVKGRLKKVLGEKEVIGTEVKR
ncbi:MAG: isopentenyl phosphate kinase [Candidatus Thermoplasmatota archaeon]